MKLRTARVCLSVFAALFLFGCGVSGRVVVEGKPPPRTDIDRYDFQVVEHTLGNGLKVLVVPRPGAKLVSCRVLVQTGSIYEGDMLGTGVSHLLEHLVAGGTTEKRTEKEYQRLSDLLGGVSNAYTSNTRTIYYVETTAKMVPTALQVLSEQLLTSRFTEREWQREKKVVLEELRRNLDNPARRLHRLLYETLFRYHPARVPVIGYANTVAAVKYDSIRAYYARRYVPSNMIVAVVGDVDPIKTLMQVNACFGKAPPGAAPPKVLPVEPKPTSPRFAEIQMRNIREGHLALAYRTIPLHHEDLYALDLAAAVLGNGRASRLNLGLRDRGLVRSISCFSFTPVYDGGVFSITAAFDYSRLKEVLEAIDAEIYALSSAPVSERELERVKTLIVADYMHNFETVGDLAEQVLVDYQGTGDPKFTLNYLKEIQKVTPQRVLEAARKYLDADKRTVVVVRPPGTKPASIVLSKWKKVPREARRSARIRKFKLDNGLTVLVKQDRRVPYVQMELYALGGVRLEKPETNGLFNLTAQAMLKGTKRRSAAQVAAEADRLGGRVGAGGGYGTFFLTMNAMSSNFDDAFRLFAEILTEPAFDEKELAGLKKNVLGRIRALEANPFSFTSKRLREAFFKNAPYRMHPAGTARSVSRLTAEDLRLCHAEYMVPENMVLAVFGDVDASKVEKTAAELLGGLPAKRALKADIPIEPLLRESKVVRKTGPFRTAIIMKGFPGISVTDTRTRPVLEVLVSILSGAGYPSGLLHEALRGGSEGLVYAVHAGDQPFVEPGFVWIIAQTDPKKVNRVLELIDKCLEKVRTQPVDDRLLLRAKRQLVVHHANRAQRLDSQAARAALNELYGNGYAWPDEMLGRMEKVTSEQVLELARRIFAKSVTLIVAPPEPPAAKEPASEK